MMFKYEPEIIFFIHSSSIFEFNKYYRYIYYWNQSIEIVCASSKEEHPNNLIIKIKEPEKVFEYLKIIIDIIWICIIIPI